MKDDERRALEAVSFNWAPTPARVWQPPEAHVSGLNEHVYRLISGAFRDAGRVEEENPLGIVVEGEPGSGKTHLLSWTRQHVHDQGGYFLLAGLTRNREFWPDIVHTFIQDLTRSTEPGTATQLRLMLDRLADQARIDMETRNRVTGRIPLTPPAVNRFEQAVRKLLPGSGRTLAAILRAMTMMASTDADLRDIGEGYLRSRLDDATGDWKTWRLPVQPAEPRETAELMSQILALTGPAVLAFDQIDTIFAQSRQSTQDDTILTSLADSLGTGLMDVRQVLRRTVLLVACLSRSWDLIQENAVGSVPDRFRREIQLDRLPTADVARRLVARRLEEVYKRAGFSPAHSTWPVPETAFKGAPDLTPRMLLQRVDWHIRACLRADDVLPVADLRDVTEDAQPVPARMSGSEMSAFDDRLEALVAETSVDAALSPDTEDVEMPSLLAAGLQAWVLETGTQNEYVVQPGAGNTPVFHAMLRHFLDADTDDQEHWSIRSIAKEHHRAVIARIERLKQAAALDPQVAKRSAVILRPDNTRWSTGPATTHTWQGFEAAGGRIITPSREDLTLFAALRVMLETPSSALTTWLMARRPAGGTTLMGQILGEATVDRSSRLRSQGRPLIRPAMSRSSTTAPYLWASRRTGLWLARVWSRYASTSPFSPVRDRARRC